MPTNIASGWLAAADRVEARASEVDTPTDHGPSLTLHDMARVLRSEASGDRGNSSRQPAAIGEPVTIGGGRIVAYNADCRDVLRQMAEQGELVHAMHSDPPYHLTSIVRRFGKADSAPAVYGTDGAFTRAARGFMGKEWDGGDIAFDPETWRLHLAALLPGGYLTAFASSRGFGEMSEAISAAGFVTHPMLERIFSTDPEVVAFWEGLSSEQASAFCQIIDSQDTASPLAWIFGSGMPKATRLKAPDTDHLRYGGQTLKPALEPIFMGQKPMEGTGTANWLAHGTGPLDIDATRVSTDEAVQIAAGSIGFGSGRQDGYEPGTGRQYGSAGRWPANVVHDGSPEVMETFAAFGDTGAHTAVDAQHNVRVSPGYGGGFGALRAGQKFDVAGTAARFFYEAKADEDDRWLFCRYCDTVAPSRALGAHKHNLSDLKHIVRHPTVKPLALARWLVRLTCPTRGQTVFDGFAGTGTTGIACLAEGRRAILVEKDPDYFRILVARCQHYAGEGAFIPPTRPRKAKADEADAPDLGSGSLLDLMEGASW